MMKKMRGKIATILILALLGLTVFPNNVVAADVTSESVMSNDANATEQEQTTVEENQLEQTDEVGDIQHEATESSENMESQSEENQEEAVVATQGLINYVGVELPYLQTPDEQKLVVSFGDGSENISDAKLVCQKSDGSELTISLSEKENELYLFRQAFAESNAGVYQLVRFSYVQDGIETTIGLADIGIEAMFGVNEYYPGYEVEPTAEVSAEDIEMSVVNVETDEVKNAETDIEEAIEATADEIEEESGDSEESDDIISKATHSFLSSMADIIMPAATAKAAENVVVVLDPGHGGSDGGAAANNLVEKNLTLKIAQYCKQELEQYSGVTVYMTRESDVSVGLTERVQMAKNWGADVFVSIHINSATAAANGVEVWYPNSSYNAAIHNQGADLSNAILKELVGLGLSDRGIKVRNSENGTKYPDGSTADYYSVIRDSKSNGFPGIIVEHAFITNPSDAAKMAQDSFLKKMGIADATGIANYFGLTKGLKVRIDNKDDFAGTAQIDVAGLGNNAKVKIWNEKTNASKTYSIANGKSTLAFNVSEYGGARGTYYIEAFNASGVSLYKDSFYVSKDTSSKITIDTDGKEKQYKVNVKFADMPSEVEEVQVPTWTKADQSDIIWYNAKKVSDGTWQATINVSDYKVAGNYNVHVYAKLFGGIMERLGVTSFSVTNPSLTVSTTDYNQSTGTFDVVIKNVVSPSGVSMIQVPVWCASNQSDINWYNAVKQNDGSYKVTVNIANHNYAIGDYKIHTYLTTGNGMMVFTGAASDVKVTLPDIVVSATDTEGTETNYTLKVTNPSLLGEIKTVQFATWSSEGDQDDIVWYNGMESPSGDWTAVVNIKNHNTLGSYNVHAYATLTNGKMQLLGTTTFHVTKPTLTVSTENYKENAGAFDVVIKNVVSPSGVSKIQVPVWCASDQSDIKWYDAVKQSDGSYRVTVSMANHNYAIGAYKIHTYLTTGSGIMVFTGAASDVNVTLPHMEISAVDKTGTDTYYTLTATNTGLLGVIRSVQFATWSSEGGQDDIVWYNGSKNASGDWTVTASIKNHKSSGTYNVHVYATLANGTMKFLGTTTFDVTKPTLAVSTENYKENAGTFDVVIKNVVSPSGVSMIQVPVWCASDQSDIRWYNAVKQNDGSYKVTVSMANHGYATGAYKVHTYITTGSGLMVFAGSAANVNVILPNMEISAVDAKGTETDYTLKATNTELLGVIKNVQFATWSSEGGQDDIIWYNGSRNASGEWITTANIKNHRSSGTYYVHAYATLANGTMKLLGTTTFNVTKPSISEISVQDYEEASGMFKVVIAGVKSPSGIEKVQVPVWCASDQSDIKWYDAVEQKDGTYAINVDPMYHKYNSGIYKIHVYITTETGIIAFAGSSSQLVVAAKYYTIMGESTTTVDQMVVYYQSSGYEYPSIELGAGGAGTLEKFCQLYYEEAAAEGIRAEVAFAQAMMETKWLQYGNIVQINQFNFAGLGAIDGNAAGNCASFKDVRTGIRAQIQHLKAYASAETLNNECVDPRFSLVTRGCAPYVEWLGQQENPNGYGWATEKGYGTSIVSMIRKLKLV